MDLRCNAVNVSGGIDTRVSETEGPKCTRSTKLAARTRNQVSLILKKAPNHSYRTVTTNEEQ